MSKIVKNFIRLSILFLIFSYYVFSSEETKAYYDCSQYGYAAYSDGSGYCKCMSGYIMGNSLGSSYCVSVSSYCYNEYGIGSEYDYLQKGCKCSSGYVWDTDFIGEQTCVSCSTKYGIGATSEFGGGCKCRSGYVFSKDMFGDLKCVDADNICHDKIGYSSSYDSLSDSCKCNYGYVIGISGQCISTSSYCSNQLGLMSQYNSLTHKCECRSGYELTIKAISGLECKSCSSKYGLHSSYNSIIDKCECDSGYTLNENNECIKKQNNVYFVLKELNIDDKQAIIRSEYDSSYYLITYGYGCYDFSMRRYANDKIVVNLGTDFDVDTGDKIVLSDDNETCEIRAVKRVSSIYSLEITDDTYNTLDTTPIIGNPIQVIPTIPEGAIIRATNGIDVYIVKYVGSKKFKRLVLSPSVFNNYGHLKWENLMVVSQAILDSFVTSDLVRAVGDSKIYRLYPQGDSGQKRLVKDAGVMTRLGLDSDSIYEINSFDRESYVTGAILE
jgi:hypothetical protein